MENNNNNNLNRSDSLRRSVRPNTTRKGLAPAPPVNVLENLNLETEVELRRPSSTISSPVPVERSTILPKISLSSITRPERSAISMRIVENKQRHAPLAREMLDEEDDANVSFALGSIEKHINQVEESFKQKNEEAIASIDELQVELIRKSKRYCETENLLHPAGSEMASDNDFQYLGGGEDLETDVSLKPQEFQRNSDVRSSMGATYTASKMATGNLTQRPKIARTASDTKNTDVLAMRAMIKQKQQQNLPQQQQQQQLQQKATTVKNQINSGSTSVVDGNTTSGIPTTTKRISQRTREENLRHFEALLAAHKASRNAGNANANANATAGTRVVHVTPRPNVVAPVLNNNNKKVIAPVLPVTTPQQQQQGQAVVKPHIISPSSAHWTPPLVIGNRNNNRLTVNSNNNNNNQNTSTNNNNNNMPQVINKRQNKQKNKNKRASKCNFTI